MPARHQLSSTRYSVLQARATRMRAGTPSEAALFAALRGKRLGVAFRRQVVVASGHIVDLLAPSLRLVIEIEGGCHERRRCADARRDRAQKAQLTCCISPETAAAPELQPREY